MTSIAETPLVAQSSDQRAALLTLVWTAVLVAVVLETFGDVGDAPFLAAQGVILTVLGIVSLVRVLPLGFWSPANVFLIIVAFFHLGLAPFWIFEIDPQFARPDDQYWFAGAIGVLALRLVSLAIAGYVVAVLFSAAIRRRRVDIALIDSVQAPDARLYAVGGSLLLVGSVIAWVVIAVAAGGLAVFTGSYIQFLELTQSTPLPYVYIAIGIGLGMTMIAPIRGWTAFAVVVFFAFAIIAFFIGLRGEVLFPVAVAATVMATRRRMPGGIRSIIVLVLGLALINLAQQIRLLGFAASNLETVQASPLNALGELGQTLRVVAHVAIWQIDQGDPLRWGETYTVSIARFLETIGGVPTPAEGDYRLFNVEVSDRSGAIGGSVIAEAFHNFGYGGVVIVMMLLGIFFAAFSLAPRTPVVLAIYVTLAVPLFTHVRNSFVGVLPAFVLGLTFVFVVWFLAKTRHGPRPAPRGTR